MAPPPSLFHGRLAIHSRYVTIMPCSGDAGERPASRVSSRSASRRASSGSPASSMRRRSSGPFAAALLLVPQLLLDGPELLAQIVFALLLGEPLLGLGGDLPSQLPHRKLALQQVDQPTELGRDGVELEQLLAGRHVDRHHRRDEVGHVAGIGEILGGRRHLVGHLRRGFHEASEHVDHRAAEGLHLRRLVGLVLQNLDPRDQIRVRPGEVHQTDPLDALDHEADGAVRHPVKLVDRAHRPDAVQVLGAGVALGLALRHEGQQPIAAHDVVDELDGARPPTVSGTAVSGSTTASRSGKTGSVSGMTKSVGPAPASAAISGPPPAWAA